MKRHTTTTDPNDPPTRYYSWYAYSCLTHLKDWLFLSGTACGTSLKGGSTEFLNQHLPNPAHTQSTTTTNQGPHIMTTTNAPETLKSHPSSVFYSSVVCDVCANEEAGARFRAADDSPTPHSYIICLDCHCHATS